MADYVAVMKEHARMCDAHKNCIECPLAKATVAANAGFSICSDLAINMPEKALGVIYKWSKEHPAQRYPTYREYLESVMPEFKPETVWAKFCIVKHFFGEDLLTGYCLGVKCEQCLNSEVSVSVAKRLGLQAKEVTVL